MLPHILMRSVLWRGIYFISVLLLNVLISRHFGAEMSGNIYYISNVLSFLLLLGSLSLESGFGYLLSAKKMTPTPLALLAFIWTLLFAGIAYLSFDIWAPMLGTTFSRTTLLFFSLCFIAGNLLINYSVALFYAKLNFKTPNLLLLGVQVLLILTLTIPLPQWLNFSDNTFLLLYYGFFLLQGAMLFVLFLHQYGSVKELMLPGKLALQILFSYSTLALLINTLTFLINRLDYYFVKQYCTAAALGNYIQVNKFAQMFYILPGMLASALFPMTAGGMRSAVNAKLQQLSRMLIFCYAMAGLMVALGGFWFFPWLLGESFQQMYLPFLLAFPGIIAFSATHLLAAYYSGKKKLSANLVGNLFALIVIVAGDILFIPVGGIAAAAAVSSVGYLTYWGYLLWLHHREYGSSIGEFLLCRTADFETLQQWVKRYLQQQLKQRR